MLGFSAIACGGTATDTARRAATAGDAGAAQVAPSVSRCGQSPRKLGDGSTFLPQDAGLAAIQITDLAVNETDVFYAINFTQSCPDAPNCNFGQIVRVPIYGGKPAIVASGIPNQSSGLVLTADRVIFSTDETNSRILSVPIVGGPVTQLAQGTGAVWVAPSSAPSSDGQNLYWDDNAGVKSLPIGGGMPHVLSTLQEVSVSPKGDVLVLGHLGSALSPGYISTIPIAGGPSTVVAANQTPWFAQSCGPNICWVNSGTDFVSNSGFALMTMAPGGQPVALTTPGALGRLSSLVNDGTYVIASSNSGIVRVPIDGGTPVAMSPFTSNPGPVAVDDECVYWVGDGIYSVSKLSSYMGPM